MKYVVQLTETAKSDAKAAYGWLKVRTSHSDRWLDGLLNAIESLGEFPQRCSLAREHKDFQDEIRHLLYGKRPHVYRVLFIVRGDVVSVLHIRHAARQRLKPSDLHFPE